VSNTPEETQKILDWAVQQLALCQQTSFYGRITFIFEGGKIVRRTAESSDKPPKLDTDKT